MLRSAAEPHHGLRARSHVVSVLPAAELMALGTALCIALSGLTTSEAFGSVGVLTVTRWNVLATLLFHATVATVMGGWATLTPSAIWQLALSGLLAIVAAAPCYYGSIALLGPRNSVLVFSLNAPLTALIGLPLFGENLGWREVAGVALVLVGIAIATRLARPDPPRAAASAEAAAPEVYRFAGLTELSPAALGILLGLGAALGQAGGVLAAKPAMAGGADPFAAMAVRFGTAAGFFLFAWWAGLEKDTRARSRDWRPFGFTMLGTTFGNGFGMTLLLKALVSGNTGIIATFAATSPIMILPLAWARTGRMPGPGAWIGAVLAVCGTALVMLG